MKNLQNRFAGFTMMELMIAIVIIGLLAALAIPASAMYMERARDAERETSLQTISLGLKNYHSDMNQYPETDNNCVPEVLSGWIEGGVVPTSPSGVLYDEGCGENGRYAYNVSGDKRSYIVAANMERKSRGNSDTDGYKVARFKTSVDHKVEVPNLTEERKGQSFFMMETSEDGIVLIAAPARAQTVASTNAPDLETLPPQTAADDVMTSAPATDDSGNNANPTNSGNNTNTDTNSNPTNSGDTNQNPSTDNSGNNTNTNNTNTNPTNSGNNTNNTNSNSEDNTNAGNDTDTNSNPTNSGDNNSNNNPTDSHIPKQPEVPVPPQPKNCIQEIRANYTIPALDHTKNTTLNFEQNNAKFTVNASCNDGTLTVTEVFSGCKEGYVRKGNENICEIKKTDKEPIFTKPETEKSGNTIKVKKHGIHDDDGVNNIKYTIKWEGVDITNSTGIFTSLPDGTYVISTSADIGNGATGESEKKTNPNTVTEIIFTPKINSVTQFERPNGIVDTIKKSITVTKIGIEDKDGRSNERYDLYGDGTPITRNNTTGIFENLSTTVKQFEIKTKATVVEFVNNIKTNEDVDNPYSWIILNPNYVPPKIDKSTTYQMPEGSIDQNTRSLTMKSPGIIDEDGVAFVKYTIQWKLANGTFEDIVVKTHWTKVNNLADKYIEFKITAEGKWKDGSTGKWNETVTNPHQLILKNPNYKKPVDTQVIFTKPQVDYMVTDTYNNRCEEMFIKVTDPGIKDVDGIRNVRYNMYYTYRVNNLRNFSTTSVPFLVATTNKIRFPFFENVFVERVRTNFAVSAIGFQVTAEVLDGATGEWKKVTNPNAWHVNLSQRVGSWGIFDPNTFFENEWILSKINMRSNNCSKTISESGWDTTTTNSGTPTSSGDTATLSDTSIPGSVTSVSNNPVSNNPITSGIDKGVISNNPKNDFWPSMADDGRSKPNERICAALSGGCTQVQDPGARALIPMVDPWNAYND